MRSGELCGCSLWLLVVALFVWWLSKPNPEAEELARRILSRKRAPKQKEPELWPVFLLDEDEDDFFDDLQPQRDGD